RYVITLGPHAYYWFALQAPTEARRAQKKRVVPTLKAPAKLEILLHDSQRDQLEREILPMYVRNCRWFGSKARTFRHLKVIEQLPISSGADGAQLWFIEISYLDAPTETYAIPVKIASDDVARSVSQNAPQAIIAHFPGSDGAVLFDAIWDATFRSQLFEAIMRRQAMKARAGDFVGVIASKSEADENVVSGNSHVVSGEQSNSSILFDNKFFLKLYRKMEDGVNPDVEINRFLTEQAGFANVPPFVGAIEYRRAKGEPTVVCLLQSAVANEGDGWTLTLDAVGRYYEIG